jgi:replicative DNA helicase
MPRAEISDRILSMRSGVPLRAIQRGRLDGEQPAAVIAAARSFSREPFAIIDAADLTAARLGSIVRRAVRRRGVKLVVIDYLQLLRPENDRDPRHLQVGTLARRVKQLARACGVPVVLLAQLNRESENRTGGKPRLADLRESGEIEAHADAAILIHPRPDQPADAPVWLSDLIVAKNRNGPVGEVALEYQRPLTRFANAARR